jgi:PAS domain S-box-containing protein
MNLHDLRPRWQHLLVTTGFGLIVVCLLAALILAPFLLRSNLETVDASALRSEMFALHLSVDEARTAAREWQGDPENGARLAERSQLLLHRIGVVLAYPGVRETLPGNGSQLDLMRSLLDRRLQRLQVAARGTTAAAPPDASVTPEETRVGSLSVLARALETEGVTFDRYVIDAFHQLGRVASYDRSRLEELSLWAQRFAGFVLVLAILTLATLWLQRRALRETGITLRSAVHDLAEAHRIAHIGTVRWDYTKDHVTWSDELARIFGLEPGSWMTGAAFQALLIPADVDRVVASEREALARSQRSGQPERRELSYRAYRSDGEVIELAALSELLADEDGQPALMVSTVRDITEEARAKRALRDSERSLSAAQRIASLGSFRRNIKTGRAHWSHEMFRMLGLAAEEGVVPLDHVVHPEDLPALEVMLAGLRTPGAPYSQRQGAIDVRMRHAKGGIRHMRGTAEMAFDEYGQPDLLTGTLRDVTSEMAQESAMREALAEAERANTAKSEFLAIMSHELRTPMNGVLGMLGAMDETALAAEQKEQLKIARSSANALLVILNDILDMSKIEAGKMELEIAPFELHPLVRSVIHLYAQRAREKGIVLDSEIGRDVPPWLTADSGRIRQILVNLVSNAVKFTATGSVIVAVERLGDAPDGAVLLRFSVTDTGIGIPLETQPQVFGRFNQLDASYTRRFGGTGLGLSICRSLAELMGGSMTFDSSPDRGSVFRLQLALHAAEAGAGAPAADSQIALPRLRILVAEDNSTNQIVARSMLERLGQNPDFVLNGQEAIEAVLRFRYDLILMDISMPVLDGLEATRQIRQLPGPRGQVPVLALTAHAGGDERRACLEAGFNEVLTKPLLLPLLQAALSRWQGDAAARGAPVQTATALAESGFAVASGLPVAAQVPDVVAAPPIPSGSFAESAAIRERLAELRLYLGAETLPGLLRAGISDLERHRAVIAAFQESGTGDREVLERSFHSLVGVANTLGCGLFAEEARQLETDAASLPPDRADIAALIGQITLLSRDLSHHLSDIEESLRAESPEECT